MVNSKTAKKSVKKAIASDTSVKNTSEFVNRERSAQNILKSVLIKKAAPVVFLVLLILGLVGYLFRDKLLVAIVDGRPIFKFELNQRLTSTFGKETLENIIVERLIAQEAKKNNITVSESEINSEVDKVTKSLGAGVKLEDALSFQGLTLGEFKRQLSIRLQVNKILEKEISVSDEEVSEFLKNNAKILVATDEAGKRTEALQRIKEQKLSERVQAWVKGLLDKAKISRFLK